MKNNILKNWISNASGKPFYFRQEFELKNAPVLAKAFVCGLGQFIFYLNGRKVGEHEPDPGLTVYRKYVPYVTFDVLPYLKQGRNAVGAEVGNGWYSMMKYGDSLVLAVDIVTTYKDGTTETFSIDESGRIAPHQVRMNNMYGSETIYGNMKKEGFSEVGYDDSDWWQAKNGTAPEGVLSEQSQPPIKVIKTYEAKYLHQANGKAIYDFGQNISGMLEFKIKGKSYTEVKFYAAEKLTEDGDADQMALGWFPFDNCIIYVIGANDIWETYRMNFTYFSGRYFAVENAGPEGTSGAELRDMTGYAIDHITPFQVPDALPQKAL